MWYSRVGEIGGTARGDIYMTYEEIVETARSIFENADARMIFDHIAVQVNIHGEGAGAFYMEVADRSICIEPYDYYDRDGMVDTDGQTIMDICNGLITLNEAVESGRFVLYGNDEKLAKLREIKYRNKKLKINQKLVTKPLTKMVKKPSARNADRAAAKAAAEKNSSSKTKSK